jgi:hypothetical protein
MSSEKTLHQNIFKVRQTICSQARALKIATFRDERVQGELI